VDPYDDESLLLFHPFSSAVRPHAILAARNPASGV
jgi:hypothetical protein